MNNTLQNPQILDITLPAHKEETFILKGGESKILVGDFTLEIIKGRIGLSNPIEEIAKLYFKNFYIDGLLIEVTADDSGCEFRTIRT